MQLNMEYLVTIGIPVYNVENYIKKSLLSALNQTFNKIEFLLIDDGSKDDSTKIIQYFQINHPRGKDIRLISQPFNRGTWAARNIILKEAKGTYIYMMDSDDYISNNCIDTLYSAAEKYKSDATYGSYRKDENGIITEGFIYPHKFFEHKDEFAYYANLKFQITVTNFVWNILIRTSFIRKHHLQFPNTGLWEDVLFNADFQPLVERALLLPDITYTYVIRNNSLSGYENRKEITSNEIYCHFNNNKYLKDQCIKLKGKSYFEMRCAKEMLQTLYSVVAILRNYHKITPRISNKKLRDEMKHPIPLKEILQFKKHKIINLIFYFLGILPTHLSIMLIKIVAKYKNLL